MKLLATALLCATTLSFGQWAGWNVVQKPLAAPKVLASFKGQYFVASDPGVVQRSVDGKSWKPSDLPSIACVNAVANSGTALAFLGCGAATVTTDGQNWETTQIDRAPNLIAVALNDSGALAVSDGGALYTSKRDFKQWTRSDSLAPVATKALVWDGTQWVAFTDSGVVSTSIDAKNWKVVVTRGPTYIRSATYFKGQYFVRSGWSTVKQSADLQYWSVLDSAYSVNVLADRIVRERLNYGGDYSWSTDGLVWSPGKHMASSASGYVLGMVQGDSGIVAVNQNKVSIRFTPSVVQDAFGSLRSRTWTGLADCHGRTLFFGHGIYSGSFDALVRESPDTLAVNAIACNDSTGVAASDRQDSILVKKRGTATWQYSKLSTGNNSGLSMTSAMWTGHEFIAGGDNYAFISSYGNWKDGVGLMWNNEATSGMAPHYISAVGAHDSILLLGSQEGEISRAVNWKNWTKIVTMYSQKGLDILGFVWGNGTFLLSTTDSTIASSVDGLTWMPNAFRIDNKTRYASTPIVYGAGRFFVGTRDSLVATSTDGKTWTSLGKLPDFVWGRGVDLVVSNGVLIVAGTYGMIATRIVDSAASVGVSRTVERKPVLLRRDGGFAVPVPQDVSEARLLTYDGRTCETIVAGNGELFVRSQGRVGRFVLAWKEGADHKRMTLPMVLMGR